MDEPPRSILVTGATGYVGGRLVPALLEHGFKVRCLARDPARLSGRTWEGAVEVVTGDVLDAGGLDRALAGVDTAFYLVHSLRSGRGFEATDVRAARGFARAARAAGVRRIVYLGGLGDPASGLSEHLSSRQRTGDALREAGVPVFELRAAVVVGSGSLSFEMIRYLTERLPVMICPRWVYTRTQPIAVDDVLAYLVAAIDVAPPDDPGAAPGEDAIVEIGGADVITYGDMMLGYASERGLWRALVPVPVLTPRLSSHWVHWVTPIPYTVAEPLIEGLRSEVVVRDDRALELFPEIRPVPYRGAVRRALEELDAGRVESTWTDALSVSERRGARGMKAASESHEGMIVDRRQLEVPAPAARVFTTVTGLGGDRGWLYLDAAWRLRGIADRALGGVGLRRGRRVRDALRPGDALDFWRVEALEVDRLLRLRAEMRLPGEAWLQFEVSARGERAATLTQTAFFAPKGLGGLAYWYVLLPVHKAIFSGMIARLAREACRPDEGETPR